MLIFPLVVVIMSGDSIRKVLHVLVKTVPCYYESKSRQDGFLIYCMYFKGVYFQSLVLWYFILILITSFSFSNITRNIRYIWNSYEGVTRPYSQWNVTDYPSLIFRERFTTNTTGKNIFHSWNNCIPRVEILIRSVTLYWIYQVHLVKVDIS